MNPRAVVSLALKVKGQGLKVKVKCHQNLITRIYRNTYSTK